MFQQLKSTVRVKQFIHFICYSMMLGIAGSRKTSLFYCALNLMVLLQNSKVPGEQNIILALFMQVTRHIAFQVNVRVCKTIPSIWWQYNHLKMMPGSSHHLRTLQTKLRFYEHIISANRHRNFKYPSLQYGPSTQAWTMSIHLGYTNSVRKQSSPLINKINNCVDIGFKIL